MHLKDKVILITGGTSGIGEACTELFARHGAKVVTMSIQQEAGTALAKRLSDEGHTCLFQFGDTSQEADVKAAVDLAVQRFGRLDCVHANAGVLRNQKITDITLDDFYTLINVNLLGPVLVAKYAVPVMERQGKGVICFTTSVAAEIGFPGARRVLRFQGRRRGPDAQLDHRPQPARRAVRGRQPGHDRHAHAGRLVCRLGHAQRRTVRPGGQEDPRPAHGPADRRGPRRGLPVYRRSRLCERQRRPSGRRHPVLAAVVTHRGLRRTEFNFAGIADTWMTVARQN